MTASYRRRVGSGERNEANSSNPFPPPRQGHQHEERKCRYQVDGEGENRFS
jgi:hypothetical protein